MRPRRRRGTPRAGIERRAKQEELSMDEGTGKRRKRPNGDASYRERPDGIWECRISLPNGKRKSLYGRTLRECQEKRKHAERETEQGVDITAPKQTVAQFLADWLENTAKPRVRPKTHHSYAQLVRLHIEPAIGRHLLSALT